MLCYGVYVLHPLPNYFCPPATPLLRCCCPVLETTIVSAPGPLSTAALPVLLTFHSVHARMHKLLDRSSVSLLVRVPWLRQWPARWTLILSSTLAATTLLLPTLCLAAVMCTCGPGRCTCTTTTRYCVYRQLSSLPGTSSSNHFSAAVASPPTSTNSLQSTVLISNDVSQSVYSYSTQSDSWSTSATSPIQPGWSSTSTSWGWCLNAQQPQRTSYNDSQFCSGVSTFSWSNSSSSNHLRLTLAATTTTVDLNNVVGYAVLDASMQPVDWDNTGRQSIAITWRDSAGHGGVVLCNATGDYTTGTWTAQCWPAATWSSVSSSGVGAPASAAGPIGSLGSPVNTAMYVAVLQGSVWSVYS